MRVIFTGSGEFALPTLRALVEAGHSVVQVFSQPDKPSGRGRNLSPTPVSKCAIELSLPLCRTSNINTESLAPADIMVVIAFGQKLSEHVISHPRHGSINLHASLLPRHRGAAPINWAIINGDQITGNSVIRLAQKMDAGAVLGTSELPIGPTDTAGEIHDRLATTGAPLVLAVLQQLKSGTAREIEQDHSKATHAPKLSREIARVDWLMSSDRVARLINGLSPWPGCQVTASETLTLLRARAHAESNGAAPGVLARDGSIGCASGCVEILEVKPVGKRAMKLADYRNGNPWNAGTRLEPLS